MIQLNDGHKICWKLPDIAKEHKETLVSLKMDDATKEVRAKDGKQYSLLVRFRATHAGRVTKNDTFYLPQFVQGALDSWTKDYNRPIQLDHSGASKHTIGRVQSAHYVDLTDEAASKLGDGMKKLSSFQLNDSLGEEQCTEIDKIIEFQEAGNDWNGLGYDVIVCKITDPDSIAKFVRDEYLTGSSGKVADTVFCNICHKDWVKDGRCNHQRGETYDIEDKEGKKIGSRKCILIAGGLDNMEYSVTPIPASEKSVKEKQDVIFEDSAEAFILNETDNTVSPLNKTGINLLDSFDSVEDILDNYKPEATDGKEKEEGDAPVTDEGEKEQEQEQAKEEKGEKEKDEGKETIDVDKTIDSILKLDGKELSDDEQKDADELSDQVYSLIEIELDAMASEAKDEDKEAITNAKLSDGERKKLSSKVFCGPNRSFPVNDCNHYTAALILLDKYKGSGDKSTIRSNVQRRGKALDCTSTNKKDSLELELMESYPDWANDRIEVLSSRLENVTDEKEVKEIRAEVEEEVYEDQIRSVNYDTHIKPLLEMLASEVLEDKKFEGKEIDEVDASLIADGIKKAILAPSARQRESKKSFILTREIPVTDKYHVMALRKLMENNEYAICTKERFLAQLALKEKALGLVNAPGEKISGDAATFDDIYNMLSDEKKKLVDEAIKAKVEESNSGLKSEHEKALGDLRLELDTESTTNERKLNDKIVDLEEANQQYKAESKVFTEKLSDIQTDVISVIVENIIDLRIINGEQFNTDSYKEELLTRTPDSLKDKLKDLREQVRREFKKLTDSDGGELTDEELKNLSGMSAEDIRYYKQVVMNRANALEQ